MLHKEKNIIFGESPLKDKSEYKGRRGGGKPGRITTAVYNCKIVVGENVICNLPLGLITASVLRGSPFEYKFRLKNDEMATIEIILPEKIK